MAQIFFISDTDIPLLVRNDVNAAAAQHFALCIGIPGGRSAVPLVQGLLSCSPDVIARLRLYLVDERLEGERNADSLRKAGLQLLEQQGARLLIPSFDESFIPEEVLSLLYLGVGEDGHVASLFPGSYPLLDRIDTPFVVCVENSPKPPPRRVSVTYRWFRTVAATAKVRLLFVGDSKQQALDKYVSKAERADSLPCNFFADAGFDVTIVTDLKEKLR
jgi:6-phosphogluconolactonase